MTEPLWPGGLTVSRETLDRLHRFQDLLIKWNARINLVSRSTIDDAWSRHILDSAQIFELAGDKPRHWLDFGSGAGFPALVCALLAQELSPETQFTLVESDNRKSAFLTTAIRETGARAKVIAKRIEDLPPQNADVISARAVAALPQLLDYANPHLAPDGNCLFPKGARFREEIDAARGHWCFSHEEIASITDPQAVILKLGNIERG